MIKTFLRRQYPFFVITGILASITAAVTTTVTNTTQATHLVKNQYNQTHPLS